MKYGKITVEGNWIVYDGRIVASRYATERGIYEEFVTAIEAGSLALEIATDAKGEPDPKQETL